MEQNTISAIASLLGAFGGLFAAIAAFRSAGSAKIAVEQALAVEKRSQVRDLCNLANSLIAETIRSDEIANKLKMAYQTLGVFSGVTGGSGITMHVEAVETKQREIEPIQTKTRKFAENWQTHRALSEEELTANIVEVEGYLIKIRRVKEELLQELESIEEQNNTYREKVINNT